MSELELSDYEKQVDIVVEALRTANGQIVFDAFACAPSENLMGMKDMIEHILNVRQNQECECHYNEHKH